MESLYITTYVHTVVCFLNCSNLKAKHYALSMLYWRGKKYPHTAPERRLFRLVIPVKIPIFSIEHFGCLQTITTYVFNFIVGEIFH